MSNQFENFLNVLKAFNDKSVDYILIGGVAVILYGMERMTRDIDVLIKMDPENIKRLRAALHCIYNDPSIDEITYDELECYPVIRYSTSENFCIDIIGKIGKIARYEDLKYEIVEYEGVKVRVVTPESMYMLKKDTLRYQDRMDAEFLKTLIENRKIHSKNDS